MDQTDLSARIALTDQLRRVLQRQSDANRLRALIDTEAEWDARLWAALAELGVLGVAIPEEYGGSGLALADLAAVAEELGRANAAVPFTSSIVLAATALAIAGSEDQKQRWLPALAAGEVVAAFALPQRQSAALWRAPPLTFAQGRLRGYLQPVPDAGVAHIALLPAVAPEGPVLVLVDLAASGVSRTRLQSFDQLRAHYAISFDAAAAELVGTPGEFAATMDTVEAWAAVQLAAEAVGGADACLAMAVAYAGQRTIFARRLASYQAIKHKLADIFAAIALARANTEAAAWYAAHDSGGLPTAASAARLTALAAFQAAARENIQVHGGIGTTFEADCHFYYRRERTLALALGPREFWADRLLATHRGARLPSGRTAGAEETPQAERFRLMARAWLADNAPAYVRPAQGHQSESEAASQGRAWQRRLHEAGYAGIALPAIVGGREGTSEEARIFAEEEARYRLPKEPLLNIGLTLALPVIQKHGTQQQQQRFIPATLRGDITWCQLFSEPAAGSDLAALRTRAMIDGNHWVINGQKIWSSAARQADWGILIARSDSALPKHKGLTFFLLDLRCPGIDIRPIRQMSGAADFCEVFLTDVRIPDDCRLDAVGAGWACAMTVLGGERLKQGDDTDLNDVGALIRAAVTTSYGAGMAMESAVVRLVLAEALAQEMGQIHFQQSLRAMVAAGQDPGALPAVVKLIYAHRLQDISGFAMEMAGLGGSAVAPDDSTVPGIWHDYIYAASLRIAGGADEVLRNQIAERVLGMPAEPRFDKTLPFNQIPT
jgi:acyl-CoA dehydrogenase